MTAFHARSRQKWLRWAGITVLIVIAAVLEKYGYGPGRDNSDRPRTTQTMPANGTVEGRPKLVDGDSFHIGGTEVRMLGIDAPEGRQTCERQGRTWDCGEEARRQLAQMIGGRPISCRVSEPDQHGRLLGTCSVGGRNLNSDMVSAGFAVAFGARYAREEREARGAKRGMWAGNFQKPQDWRHAHGIGGGR